MSEAFPAPEIVEQPERHLAVVRDTVAFEAIAELYDRAFPVIFGALGQAGIPPVAPPMGVVHGMQDGALDLAVAVPVAEPFPGDGEVVAETLPAGPAATLMVRGDYGQLADAYEYLHGWISEQGLTPGGPAFEQYLTEPEPGGDPSLNETLIAIYLAD